MDYQIVDKSVFPAILISQNDESCAVIIHNPYRNFGVNNILS